MLVCVCVLVCVCACVVRVCVCVCMLSNLLFKNPDILPHKNPEIS